MLFDRRKFLLPSCAYAIANCSAGFRGDAGSAAAPFLCGLENVPPANARTVAQLPKAGG